MAWNTLPTSASWSSRGVLPGPVCLSLAIKAPLKDSGDILPNTLKPEITASTLILRISNCCWPACPSPYFARSSDLMAPFDSPLKASFSSCNHSGSLVPRPTASFTSSVIHGISVFLIGTNQACWFQHQNSPYSFRWLNLKLCSVQNF